MENFSNPTEKKNKKNRNRIANSLANPTETLRPPPYPTRPAPCRTFFAFVFALWYCRCGALGPSCLKLLFMIMGPRRFGSVGVRFGGRRRIWEGRSVFALLGEAKNAKQQSNNKEKEQNENRKKQQKMVLYLWATERAELYKSRPNSPNQNLNRTHSDNTHSHTTSNTNTHVHSKKPGKSIKDYFRSFFCTLICLQLIFFLADETKRAEPSRVIKEQ